MLCFHDEIARLAGAALREHAGSEVLALLQTKKTNVNGSRMSFSLTEQRGACPPR